MVRNCHGRYRAHLVDEDAQSPPVDSLRVALAEDDLRRKILGCTTERPETPRQARQSKDRERSEESESE